MHRKARRSTAVALLMAMVVLAAVGGGCSKRQAEDGDAGVYTAEYIGGISIDEPERALALIDTAVQKGLMNDFNANRMRALVYHNGLSDNIKSLEYAKKAYESPEARENTKSFMSLLSMLSDQYYLSGDYLKSIEICTEGIAIARDSLMKGSEADLNFTLGRNLLMLNREAEGFQYYKRAVDILDEESKKDKTWSTADDYVYTLAIYIGTLRNKERLEEATALLPRYEKAVEKLESKEDIPEGLADMRRASGYGMAAVLYAIKGEKVKADEQYRKLLSTEYAKTPDAGQLIIPYLYQTGEYREALRHLQEEKKFWQENTDTVSYSYIQNHLESELEVYEKLGDIRSANRVLHTIKALTDSLQERDRNEKALELAEIYKTQQQALQIERQSTSILIRNVVIIACVILFIFGIIFIFRILRYNRAIKAKNRVMVKTIEDLIEYKERVIELQEENLRLKVMPLDIEPEPTDNPSDAVAEENVADDAVELSPGDKALFERVNLEILSQRLYLEPDFSRASVLARFRIPAYKFSTLFKEFAGCTFSQYIHNCRLDYAVKLMRENSSWSLEAIAKASQMSSSSFYSQFKKRYGMSPSDFRANESQV